MSVPTADGARAFKPLRLWPGVVIVALQWLGRFGVPAVVPEGSLFGVLSGVVGAVALLVWWLFFSRARWMDRLGGLALMVAALLAVYPIADRSISTGAMGMLLPILAIPGICLAFVAALGLTRSWTDGARRWAVAAAVVASCAVWTLVRTGGFSGDFKNDLSWRWSPTPEDRLVAQAPALPVPAAAPEAPKEALPEAPVVKQKAPTLPVPAAVTRVAEDPAAEWSGFRGPQRDGVVRGVRIEADWAKSPPERLWRRAVGPGWSSFAVHGDRVYTQEQRGPEEVVACYQLRTGEPIWAHKDTARFWESNAGAGPRATPTLGKGRVYTLGGTGILNALNAADGAVVWSHEAARELGATTPEWGFAGSPLLFNDLVIVAVSGQLSAYDAATGTPRWTGPRGGPSYSSPHLVRKDGVAQVVLLSGEGAKGFAPADGKLLWEHAWRGYPIVQPAVTTDGDLLISVSDSSGTRRLGLTQGADGWHAEERWTTNGLKPYFNDFVVHNGHAYGFDGGLLACIGLEDGKRKWKGGRYGHGQLVLLAGQDLLLVLSEQGELALVRAAPNEFAEVARMPAIEGKTWNHPVLAGDILLARNAEEMTAFRVVRTDRAATGPVRDKSSMIGWLAAPYGNPRKPSW